MKIILASSSPRRMSLLTQIGLHFEVRHPSGFTEHQVPPTVFGGRHSAHRRLAEFNALMKARKVAEGTEGKRLVLGADTIVVYGKDLLGKPEDVDDARHMLRLLSGRTHKVITGVALIDGDGGREVFDSEVTEVTFKKLSRQEIMNYIMTGEPMDKAGAYGIQGLGALLVEGIKGCYFNVVGLPLTCMSTLFRSYGIRLL
jgi:septum formation protein